jgi:antitoxin VapB
MLECCRARKDIPIIDNQQTITDKRQPLKIFQDYPMEDVAMQTTSRVRIVKDGRNRAIPIPSDFNLPGDEVILRKEGQKLIVEPAFPTLLSTLATLETLDENFPNVDDSLLAPDAVEI